MMLPCSKPLMAQLSQDTTTVWVIEMKDGNKLFGRIMKKELKTIFFRTENIGTLAITRKDIKSRRIYEPEIDGESSIGGWRRNKMYGRYLFTPTGMMQQKGEHYYENKYIFVNHMNLVLSDGFSLGLGMMPLFLFDNSNTPVWVIPKFRIPIKGKKFHLSTGIFVGTTLFNEYDDGNIFIPFLAATYGDRNINFSVSVGYGSAFDERMRAPTIAYSGTVRLSNRAYAFIENIVITGNTYESDSKKLLLFTMGLRTIWQKVSLDFGVINVKDPGEFIFYNETDYGIAPYLGLLIPFH